MFIHQVLLSPLVLAQRRGVRGSPCPGCFDTFPRRQPSSSGADFLGAGSVASSGRLSVASQLRLASAMEGIYGCSEARFLLGIAAVRGSQQRFA